MSNDSINRCGAGCLDNLRAQATSVPPDETMSSTSKTGPSLNDLWVGQCDLYRTIATPCLLRNRVSYSKPAGKFAHPRPGLGVRADDDSSRVKSDRTKGVCDRRHGRQVVGLDARENLMDIGGAMEMRVDRNDPVHKSSEEPADDFLADCLPRLKGGVLAHVAEIGRDQNEPLGAIAPQRFGGEQNCKKLFIGPIERRINNRRRRRRRDGHAQFPVRKPVYCDLVHRNAKPRCEPCCIARDPTAGFEW